MRNVTLGKQMGMTICNISKTQNADGIVTYLLFLSPKKKFRFAVASGEPYVKSVASFQRENSDLVQYLNSLAFVEPANKKASSTIVGELVGVQEVDPDTKKVTKAGIPAELQDWAESETWYVADVPIFEDETPAIVCDKAGKITTFKSNREVTETRTRCAEVDPQTVYVPIQRDGQVITAETQKNEAIIKMMESTVEDRIAQGHWKRSNEALNVKPVEPLKEKDSKEENESTPAEGNPANE